MPSRSLDSTRWSDEPPVVSAEHHGGFSATNRRASKRPHCDADETIVHSAKRPHLHVPETYRTTGTIVKTKEHIDASQLPSPEVTNFSADCRDSPTRSFAESSPSRGSLGAACSISALSPTTVTKPCSVPTFAQDQNVENLDPVGKDQSLYLGVESWLSATTAVIDEEEEQLLGWGNTHECNRNTCAGCRAGCCASDAMYALKRQPSRDSIQLAASCGDDADSVASADAKSNFYSSPLFPTLMKRNGNVMCDSTKGLDPDELDFCQRLFSSCDATHPSDQLLEGTVFPSLIELSRNKSEQWLIQNLYTHLFPSPELLNLCGQKGFDKLVEACDEQWLRMPFPSWGKCPQPDCTIAFKWETFSNEEVRKMGIVVGASSKYTARDDMFFPFMTREAKCAKQPVENAFRQNLYSMGIALDGVVDLFRRVGQLQELNGKVLGLSLAYDNDNLEVYAHHVATSSTQGSDDEVPLLPAKWTTKKYLTCVRKVRLSDDAGHARWLPWEFFYNACRDFSARHLKRVKAAVALLPDPADDSFRSITNEDEPAQGSQSSEFSFKKPRNGTIHAELRKQNEILLDQLRQLQEQLRNQQEQSVQQLDALRTTMAQQLDDSKQHIVQQKEIIDILKTAQGANGKN